MVQVDPAEELMQLCISADSAMAKACTFAELGVLATKHLSGEESVNLWKLHTGQSNTSDEIAGFFERTTATSALVMIVTILEEHLKRMYWVRLVIERHHSLGRRLTEDEALEAKRQAFRDWKGVVDLRRKVVENASKNLGEMTGWLDDVCQVRNIIIHNSGVVHSTNLDEGSNKVAVRWRVLKVKFGGKTFKPGMRLHELAEITFSQQKATHEWTVGDRIVLTPADLRNVSIAMSAFMRAVASGCFAEIREKVEALSA